MTIYVFGDPQLLREALFALASIFNLAEWSDPGNAMGVGGNMLAMALIGLVAIGVYGIIKQEVRVDYLLVSLILFGILFAAKVDVNVEDIQTGDASVVADIPIGIAAVAAAASTAARNLTETTGTALQRPGSVTSVLSNGGFLDPLRVLLSLRPVGVKDINTLLHKSLLEYYKNCVGRTRVVAPGIWDHDAFLNDPDPVAYLFTDANVMDFTTVEYTAAAPGGVAGSCRTINDNLDARLDDIGTGVTPEVETYLRRSMGSRLYNASFEHSDVVDAVDNIFRGGLAGQDFMKSLFLRNLYNTAEAYSVAEYGTNTTQYVAAVTTAFESQRVSVATEGTMFLQMMFPLMTFLQFMFFALAPFVALVIVASPFTSMKTAGMYLLFGVWTYSWMPIAAVINHYMEITLQNDLEFSDIILSGSGYTSILGFDDFYNMLATKITIGSNALAAVPMITAAVLAGSVFGISSMAKGMANTAGSGSKGADLAAPKLAANQPVVSIGGRFASGTGVTAAPGGGSGKASKEETDSYGTLSLNTSLSNTIQGASARQANAQREFDRSSTQLTSTVQSMATSKSATDGFNSQYTTQLQSRMESALTSATGHDFQGKLSADQTSVLAADLGVGVEGAKISEATRSSKVDGYSMSELSRTLKTETGGFSVQASEALSATSAVSKSESADLRDMMQSTEKAQEEWESAVQATQSAQAMKASAAQMGVLDSRDITEIAGRAERHMSPQGAVNAMSSVLASKGAGVLNWVNEGGQGVMNSLAPPSLDGEHDPMHPTTMSQNASRLRFLANEVAAGNEKALPLLMESVRSLAGMGAGLAMDRNSGLLDESGASTVVDDAGAFLSDATARSMGGAGSNKAANAESAINSELKPQNITAGAFDAVQEQYEGNSAFFEQSDQVSDIRPDLAGEAVSAKERFRGTAQGMASENNSLSNKAVEMFGARRGFNDFGQGRVSQLSEAAPQQGEEMSDGFIRQLDGAMAGQFGGSSKLDDPELGRMLSLDQESAWELYQEKLASGNYGSKRQAALATYGEVGRRSFAAMDMMVGGMAKGAGAEVGGIADSLKGGKGKKGGGSGGVFSTGGKTVGLALTAGAVFLAKNNDSDESQAAAKEIAMAIQADAHQLASRGEISREAEKRIDVAMSHTTDFNGLFEVLDELVEGGGLTDAEIDKLRPTETSIAESVSKWAGFGSDE